MGLRKILFVPALTDPEKATSFAVMDIGELVVLMDVETALVTFPVPSAVIVMPLVPVTLLLRVIAPLEPDDVVNRTIFPLDGPAAERVPLAVKLRVPLVETALLATLRLAEAPVVVTEKLPPTTDEPRVVAPALEIVAVPGLPVFALNNAVEVSIGVPEEPIEPVMVIRLTLPEVRVAAPDRVIEPVPPAKIWIAPLAPVDILALIVVSELVPLDKLMVAVPETAMAAPMVNVPLDVTVTGLVVPEIAPRVIELEAKVWMFKDLAPSVMVCPAEVMLLALRKSRL